LVALRKLEDIVKKWSEVTPNRATYYEAGIRAPLRDWATRAAAANDAWKAGITDAASKDLFKKGVTKAGTDKWQRKALAVGPGRFAEGVRVAAPDYQEGWAPYHEVLSKLELPQRGRRGDPKNIERVRAIAQALYKKRIGEI